MSTKNLAILVSASHKETLKERKYGSVMSHAIHLGSHGKVFWQVGSPGPYISTEFRYPDIKKGYFYLTSIQKIFYTFDIEFIKAYSEIENASEYLNFVPEWRLSNWKSQKKGDWGYWILIKDIKELKKLYNVEEFILARKEEPEEVPPQAYSIVIDPMYETV